MKSKRVRVWVQIIFFGFVLLGAIGHTLEEAGIKLWFLPTSSLHGICPFGGIETLYKLFTQGTFIQKIHESSIVMLVVVLLLSLLFGGVFCGWICPLGSIQEWIGKLGKKIFKKRYNKFIPYKYDKYLRYSRYLFLVWVIYMTIESGKLFLSTIDPYSAMFQFWTSEIAIGGLVILVVTLVLSLFIERPWCKYLCPLGAVLGVFNTFRIFKIKRNESTCIGCGKCTKECPMNIKVNDSKVVRNHQCISCMKCTSEEVCPIKDTVILSIGKEASK